MAVETRSCDVETIFPLRHAVLRAGLPPESAMYEHDRADHVAHFGAFDGETLVGCVTVHLDPLDGEPAWRLRGMAVADGVRTGGVGRKLLEAVDQHVATTPGPVTLWCNARLPAVGFYERCGWDAVTDVYDIPGVGPHRKMVRRRT
ncbi:MAG: GNAT family N-acetyltransferase [Tepidisphaeraceae bacterium]